jgi:hypothetical protein
LGTRFGKTLGDFTLAGHVEYLQTFGNHNNKIAIERDIPVRGTPYNMGMIGFPDEISVDLKSTHETTAGFDAMYQMNKKWSFGAGFEYIEHANNGVKGVHTKMPNATSAQVADGLVQMTSNMKDGWDEYVIKTSAAFQMTDDVQFAVFGEYTLDDTQSNSQNATNCKLEFGARVNARF